MKTVTFKILSLCLLSSFVSCNNNSEPQPQSDNYKDDLKESIVSETNSKSDSQANLISTELSELDVSSDPLEAQEKKSIPEKRSPKRKKTKHKGTQHLLGQLASKPQNFQIDPKQEQLIIGEEGTQITIPGKSFVYSDGRVVTGNVDIELTECLTTGSLISNQLTTQCGNEMLQTGGTIKLQATCNGETVKLVDEVMMELRFPARNGNWRDMMSFLGEPAKEGIVWKPDNIRNTPPHLSIASTKVLYKQLEGFYLDGGTSLEEDFENYFLTAELDNCIDDEATQVSYTLSRGIPSNIEIDGAPSKTAEQAIHQYFSQLKLDKRKGIGKLPYDLRVVHDIKTIEHKANHNAVKYQTVHAAMPSAYTDQKITYKEEPKLETKYNPATKREEPYYTIKTRSFGWINCDRYRKDPRPKTNIEILAKEYPGAQVMFVIPSENGILPATFMGMDRRQVQNIPMNEKGYLVTIYSDGKDNYYERRPFTVGSRDFVKIRPKKCSLEKIKSDLKKLTHV